ncbi:hypothetical protein D3C87_1257780 [compost metagenome]
MGQRFENELHVAHGNALANQPLQHFGDLLHGDVAIDLLEQVGVARFHFVEQLLGFLHAEKLLDIARQQRDQAAVAFFVSGTQVIAQLLHPLAVGGVDPDTAQAIAVIAAHQGKTQGFQLRRIVEQSPVIEMDIELLGADFIDQHSDLRGRQCVAGTKLRFRNAQAVVDEKLAAKARRPARPGQFFQARCRHQQHQGNGFGGDVVDFIEQSRLGLQRVLASRCSTTVTLSGGSGGFSMAHEHHQPQHAGNRQKR